MAVWNRLPNELRLQILGHLAHKDGDRASYGSVCRQWLQIMEPYIFEDIPFYVTNASILSGTHTPLKLAAALRGSRLKYLKRLRLVVDIDLFTFTSISHAHSQRMQLAAAFVEVVDGFVDVLRNWKEDGCFKLQVYDVADCGHHLLEYDSNLLSKDDRRRIQCVSALRSVMHMEGQSLCHSMDYNGTGTLSGVGHPRLSHLLLLNMSSNMKELSYGGKGAKVFMYDTNPEIYPRGLTSLELRNAGFVYEWRADVLAAILERLHINDEGSDFEFTSFCQGPRHLNMPSLRWPKLKHISWGRLPLTWQPNEMLLHMAHAAGRMPMLESVDLWGDEPHPDLEDGESPPLNAHFHCTIDDNFVSVVFRTTGELQPDDNVREAWRAVAKQRSRQLGFEVEQVASLDYMQPFTSPAVEDFFDRHIYIDESSHFDYRRDIHFADRLLRLRGVELEPVGRKHMYTCLDCDGIEYVSSCDDIWVRYLRKPQGGRQSILETI